LRKRRAMGMEEDGEMIEKKTESERRISVVSG
jgi:hypothetical protein